MRIECFDISNLMGHHTAASMVVFEGGAPKKSDYRRFAIRDSVQDDFAAMAEVLSRRMAQYVKQRERSPHDKEYDESFASLPALIVIDGGKGQLSAGLSELGEFEGAWRDDREPRQADRAAVRAGLRDPVRLAPTRPSCSCSSASATSAPLRDRIPPRQPRQGNDRSILDEIGGHRPAASAASSSTSARPIASCGQVATSSRRCPVCPARWPATSMPR